VNVPALTAGELDSAPCGDSSTRVRARVLRAREAQQRRQGMANALLPGAQVEAHVRMNAAAAQLMRAAAEKLWLSARARHRVLRAARTIADLEGHAAVREKAMAEALTYRGAAWG
jgi:magnesium chelatase family protein